MANYYTTRPLLEGAMLTAVTVIMAIMGTALPIFFFLVYILPVPIAINIFRHGLRWGIISIAASCLLTGIVFGIYPALSVITGTLLVSPALGFGFRKFSPVKTLVISITASVVSVALAIGIGFFLMNINILQDMQNLLNASTESSLSMYKAMGMSEADIEKYADQLQKLIKLIILVFPASIALLGAASAFVNFLLTRHLLKRFCAGTLAGLPPFGQWRLSIGFLFLFGFSLVGMYWGSTRNFTALYNICFNVNYFASMFCRLQGLSLLYCALQHFKLSALPKILIMFFVIVTPLMDILMYAGLFDMIFDYRTRLSKRV